MELLIHMSHSWRISPISSEDTKVKTCEKIKRQLPKNNDGPNKAAISQLLVTQESNEALWLLD